MATQDYPLRPFRIHDHDSLLKIIERHPLATLISAGQQPENISLVPLYVDSASPDDLRLIGHVDRNNPQAKVLVPGHPVAFVFQGPNAYASPDIYSNPQLPGWLYVMIKGAGVVSRSIEGREAVEMLCHASHRFGGENQVFNLSSDDSRFDLFINAIVGFEIEVTSISGISKLAQDKGSKDSKIATDYLNRHNSEDRSVFLEAMRATTEKPAGS